eukprot:TRINITY_DN776000_c0_g1_i1.p1 TRINITY_DN776000_c0_g1~~TRINITY_DN776000_c0_g1_i1.p1  ORF type:complete len:127 (+),score=23.54 TRINITY_DN776000_c0_g1_i1:91-471(+)
MNKSLQFLMLTLLIGVAAVLLTFSCIYYGEFWPMLVVFGYAMLGIPFIFTAGQSWETMGDGNKTFFLFGQCMFGVVASMLIGLPIVLARVSDLETGHLIMFGVSNVLGFIACVILFLKGYKSEEDY